MSRVRRRGSDRYLHFTHGLVRNRAHFLEGSSSSILYRLRQIVDLAWPGLHFLARLVELPVGNCRDTLAALEWLQVAAATAQLARCVYQVAGDGEAASCSRTLRFQPATVFGGQLSASVGRHSLSRRVGHGPLVAARPLTARSASASSQLLSPACNILDRVV